MSQQIEQAPNLEAPGAGLPVLEHRLIDSIFRMYRAFQNRDAALRKFQSHGQFILDAAAGVSENQGRQRVLTRRVFGIEDSSRFWSPYMVVHHLIIVDSSIIKVIEALAAGKSELREAKIADVKPSLQSGPEVVDHFRTVLSDYSNRLTKIADLHTEQKHAHPWFGLLDGYGWHCLAALHHGIHKRQLSAILETPAL